MILQAHIRRENERLEAELSFESSEIIVRIEYKYAPNLIIIDTPGLLPTVEAPTADTEGGDDAARAVANDPQLGAQARAVEELVGGMIKPEGHVILCVEETSSWQYSPARAVVQRARHPAVVVMPRETPSSRGCCGRDGSRRTLRSRPTPRSRAPSSSRPSSIPSSRSLATWTSCAPSSSPRSSDRRTRGCSAARTSPRCPPAASAARRSTRTATTTASAPRSQRRHRTCYECRMRGRSLTADPRHNNSRHNNRRAPTARTCRPSSAARAPSSPTRSGSTASDSRG